MQSVYSSAPANWTFLASVRYFFVLATMTFSITIWKMKATLQLFFNNMETIDIAKKYETLEQLLLNNSFFFLNRNLLITYKQVHLTFSYQKC